MNKQKKSIKVINKLLKIDADNAWIKKKVDA